jgi:hypothetical protein
MYVPRVEGVGKVSLLSRLNGQNGWGLFTDQDVQAGLPGLQVQLPEQYTRLIVSPDPPGTLGPSVVCTLRHYIVRAGRGSRVKDLAHRLSDAGISYRRWNLMRPAAWMIHGFTETVQVDYPDIEGLDEIRGHIVGAVRILEAVGVTPDSGRWRWRAYILQGGGG